MMDIEFNYINICIKVKCYVFKLDSFGLKVKNKHKVITHLKHCTDFK